MRIDPRIEKKLCTLIPYCFPRQVDLRAEFRGEVAAPRDLIQRNDFDERLVVKGCWSNGIKVGGGLFWPESLKPFDVGEPNRTGTEAFRQSEYQLDSRDPEALERNG